jgi:hypothetical protein
MIEACSIYYNISQLEKCEKGKTNPVTGSGGP